MRSALRTVAVVLWALWHILSLCRACAEEERDAALLAADAGMSAREWRRANRKAGL